MTMAWNTAWSASLRRSCCLNVRSANNDCVHDVSSSFR